MKQRIFALGVALVAFAGMASAQHYVMQVNLVDGTEAKEYDVDDVVSVELGTEYWQEWATGTYEYHNLWNDPVYDEDWGTYLGGEPVEKAGLKIYRSSFNPKRFKIGNWNYKDFNEGETDTYYWITDVDFYFSYDEETGEVSAEDGQYAGCLWINTGENIYVEEAWRHALEYGEFDPDNPDEVAMYCDPIPRSYKDGDTFYFSLTYYLPSMNRRWGRAANYEEDYETLTITSYVNGAPAGN